MKRITIPALLAIVLFICQSLSYAAVNQFTGTWKNADPNTGGITKLTISGNANSLKMRAWGKCHPQDCDWGEVSAYAYATGVSSNLEQNAQAVSAIFTTGFSQTQVIVKPLGSNRLRADVYTRFTDGSGRSNYSASYTFNRQLIVGPIGPIGPVGPIQPLPVLEEDCVSFNPNTTTVRNIYLLVNGNAPQGSMPGEDCVSFNPNTIEVKNIGGRWKIVDGSHWVFDFNNKENEARTALAIIKKYGFTRSCFVGRPDASFQYLRK